MEPIPVAEGIRAIPVPALPPYNGFGSFEDSEQSCKNLVSTALASSTSIPPITIEFLPANAEYVLGVSQPYAERQHAFSTGDIEMHLYQKWNPWLVPPVAHHPYQRLQKSWCHYEGMQAGSICVNHFHNPSD